MLVLQTKTMPEQVLMNQEEEEMLEIHLIQMLEEVQTELQTILNQQVKTLAEIT